MKSKILLAGLILIAVHCTGQSDRNTSQNQQELDKQVSAFLKEHRDQWQDLNVPYTDGQLLYNLVVENGYKNIVEIGTSTGHSTLWLAWAASKTGGKVITIEIDEDRYNQALKNFEEAGVAEYVDARLADAHELVEELEGPIDFVFSDADKTWYTNYFQALYPKMSKGGCFTAHNVSMDMNGIQEFLDHLETVPGLETTINTGSGSGMSVSYKKE